jgi:hypothetical protein
MYIAATQAHYTEFMDIEKQSETTTVDGDAAPWVVEERLDEISRRLAEEVRDDATEDDDEKQAPAASVAQTPTTADISPSTERATGVSTGKEMVGASRLSSRMQQCGIDKLRMNYEAFTDSQHEIFTEVLVSGKLHGDDDSLRLHGE